MPQQIDPALRERLDGLFAQWRSPRSPGAALAIVRDGEVVYAKGYGLANLEYAIPITPETIFHSASIAKQVTALAVLLLADRGRLSVDDPIHKYMPELPDFGHAITLRQMLQHTSGLREVAELLALVGWRAGDVVTTDHVLRLVHRQRELDFPPGTEFSYCNTGYALLAEVVARVSGQSLRAFAHENIFRPLSMDRTHFHDDHEEIVPDRAYSYAPAPGRVGFRKSVLNYGFVGSTSLFTTVTDLAKWVANFEHPVVGTPDLLRQMQEPAVLNSGQEIGYGFGVGLVLHRGLWTVQHKGVDAGYRSHVCWVPDRHLGVIILANAADVDAPTLALRAVDLCQGVDEEQPSAEAPALVYPEPTLLSEAQLQPYAGSYYSEELDTTYRLSPDAGGLLVRHLKREDLWLAAIAPDTFLQVPAGPLKFRFVRRDGRVTGFRLDGARVRNLWFAHRTE